MHEVRAKLVQSKDKFEGLAVAVLQACHAADHANTSEMILYEAPRFCFKNTLEVR